MKIIDQTPLLDEKGQLSLVNRVQGMLKYGFSWPANLEAQRTVIAQMNRVIEKGFTLFRNQQLGVSEIIVPLILVGPSGVYVMDATPLKGLYRARGNEWGTVVNERFQPAAINLLDRTAKLAKIVQVFFERQGTKLAAPVEPVLLAANPGMQIESLRPAVRVVMRDAIDRFAAGLLTARPLYNPAQVSELVERIQNPRSARRAVEKPPEPQEDAFAQRDETPFPDMEPSRMNAILNSPQSDALIESGGQSFQQAPSDLDFALEEEPSPTVMVRNPPEPYEDERQERPAAPPRRRILGMTILQLALLAFMALVECCALAGFAALFYFNR